MGKPKTHSSKAKRLAKKKAAASSGSSYTVDELLDKAAELMEEYKYDLAQKFCQRALEQEADHPRALEMTGNLLLELGEVEKAQHCLGRAIVVCPEVGHSKYMTAAQLFPGTQSRDLYLKGIEVLHTLPSTAETKSELSTAHVALAELFMTDLCDEEEAAAEAKRHINLATEVDPSNPEGWQALASYLLVLGDSEEAGVAMDKSLDLWLPKHTAWVASGEGEQTNLSYDTRLASVKVLLDLERFDTAAEILDSLLEEDNEVVAAWYLHGWLNYLRNDPDFHGNVRHYLKRAQQVHVMSPTDDEAMMEHIKELLAEVGEKEEEEVEGAEGDDQLEYTEENMERAQEIAQILDNDGAGEREEPMEA